MSNFFLEYVLPIIGSAVGLLLTGLLGAGIRWFSNKTGIDIRKEKVDTVNKGITDIVFAGEERAAAILKPKVDDAMSKIKLGWALNLVGNRFPELTREEADTKVHAIIGMTKGLGASGDAQKKEMVQATDDMKGTFKPDISIPGA